MTKVVSPFCREAGSSNIQVDDILHPSVASHHAFLLVLQLTAEKMKGELNCSASPMVSWLTKLTVVQWPPDSDGPSIAPVQPLTRPAECQLCHESVSEAGRSHPIGLPRVPSCNSKYIKSMLVSDDRTANSTYTVNGVVRDYST